MELEYWSDGMLESWVQTTIVTLTFRSCHNTDEDASTGRQEDNKERRSGFRCAFGAYGCRCFVIYFFNASEKS
jgi:hypothetical protein